MKKAPKKSTPVTPSKGMMPAVRKAIADGRTDAQILAMRTPSIPITPGTIAYARRTAKKAAPTKKAAPGKPVAKAKK